MTTDLISAHVVQGDASWHSLRREVWRTASRAPAAMDCSLYGTKAALVTEIAHLLAGGEPTPLTGRAADAAAWGREREPFVRAALEDQLGLILACPTLVREIEGVQYLASMDGTEGVYMAQAIPHEIKAPVSGRQSTRWKLAERGLALPHDRVQIAQQAMVTGADRGELHIRGDADEDILTVKIIVPAELTLRIRVAWAEVTAHVVAGTIPADDQYPEREDLEWSLAAIEFADAKRQADAAATGLLAARERMLALAPEGNAQGAGVRLGRHERRGPVDYSHKHIRNLLGDLDLEQYRKKSSLVETIRIYGE